MKPDTQHNKPDTTMGRARVTGGWRCDFGVAHLLIGLHSNQPASLRWSWLPDSQPVQLTDRTNLTVFRTRASKIQRNSMNRLKTASEHACRVGDEGSHNHRRLPAGHRCQSTTPRMGMGCREYGVNPVKGPPASESCGTFMPLCYDTVPAETSTRLASIGLEPGFRADCELMNAIWSVQHWLPHADRMAHVGEVQTGIALRGSDLVTLRYRSKALGDDGVPALPMKDQMREMLDEFERVLLLLLRMGLWPSKNERRVDP